MKKAYFNLFIVFILGLFVSCEGLLYHPEHKIYATPHEVNLQYEEIIFNTNDHLNLKGWLIKSKSENKKGTILHFHGNAQNRSTHFFQLSWLVSHGFDLIIPDYRGYGGSQGSPNKKDIYHDSLIFLRDSLEIHQRLKNKKFILWGQSLGGNIALRAATEFQEKIDLLILDSTFSSYQEVAKDVLKRNFLTYLFSPLGSLLIDDEYSGAEVIDQIKTPTMILHGTNDSVIPFEFSKRIYEQLKTAPKTLIAFEQVDHLQAFHQKKYRLLFLQKLEEFYLKNK